MPPSRRSRISFRSFLRADPVLPLAALLGLALGGNLAFFFFVSVSFFCALFVAVLIAFFLRKRRRSLAVFLCCLALSGSTVALWPKGGGDYGTYVGVVRESKRNYFIFESGMARYYVYEKDNERQTGDWLRVTGKPREYKSATYESRFDFGEYLRSRGVRYEIRSKGIEEILSIPPRLRSAEKRFLRNFSGDASALLGALLFDRTDYSNSVISKASSLGALYFMSSSGLILSIALRGIEKLLRLGCKEKTAERWAFACSVPFLLVSPMKIGFQRVFSTRLMRLLLNKGDDRPPSYVPVCLSGILLCVLDPLAPLRSGFYIGYGLALALCFSRSYLSRAKGTLQKLAYKGACLSFLFPVYVTGGAFHLLCPLYSAIILPIVLPFGAIGFISFLTLPFITVLNGYASFISMAVGALEMADVPIPIGGEYGPIAILAFYTCLMAISYLGEIGFRRWQRIIGVSMLAFSAVNAAPIGNSLTAEVSFINVGQGDAILIRDGFHSVMIDTGGNLSFDMAREVDIPFLRKERIYHLDCLIASHGDFDHIGAKESLMKNFSVGRFVDDASEFPIKVGDMELINLNTYAESSPDEDENASSLVIYLELMGKKWLFTGDAPKEIEARIIDDNPSLDVDILKAGHHGSDTSSGYRFVEAISPETAIISVGEGNRYGHPSEETLRTFRRLGVEVRRTDLEGTITYRSPRWSTLS
jgi:competence protein ComEC